MNEKEITLEFLLKSYTRDAKNILHLKDKEVKNLAIEKLKGVNDLIVELLRE